MCANHSAIPARGNLATCVENTFRCDDYGVLMTARQLLHLVRDNGYTSEYTARFANYEDSQRQVNLRGQHYFAYLAAYRLRGGCL